MSKEKREKRPKSKARKIIEWVLIGIVGALFLLVGAGQIESMVHKDTYFSQPIRFGVGSFVVKTDSMEPEYKVDSTIITYRKNPDQIYADFQAGKTIDITFMDIPRESSQYYQPTDTTKYRTPTSPTNRPMTHRLREIHINPDAPVGNGRYSYIVSGINLAGHESGEGQYQAFSDRYVLGVVVLNSDFLGGVFGFVASPWGLFILLLVPAFYLVIVSTMDIFKAFKEPKEEGAETSAPAVSSLSELSEADKKRLKEEMLQQMLEKKAQEKAKQAESAPKEEEHHDQ